jgi:hypothetical protein
MKMKMMDLADKAPSLTVQQINQAAFGLFEDIFNRSKYVREICQFIER